MNTWQPTLERLEVGKGEGSELRADLFEHQSRSSQGTARHNISPGRCGQTLPNQTLAALRSGDGTERLYTGVKVIERVAARQCFTFLSSGGVRSEMESQLCGVSGP